MVIGGLLASVVIIAETPAEAQDRHKTVLSLYSGRRGAAAASALDSTLERSLKEGLNGQLDYYAEFIDLARFPEPDYETAVREFLRSKYKQHRFDLIVATTNAPLQFVIHYRDDLFPGVPVVYNAGPGTRAAPNTAGVSAPLNFRDTLSIALQLQPDKRRVVVVSGASAWDEYYRTAARAQFKEFEGRVAFTWLSGLPMPELLRRVARLPADSIVYFLTVAEDGDGNRFVAQEALSQLAAVANVPTYSWHETCLDRGIVGGSLQSDEVLAKGIAAVALRVLGGENPAAIPVQVLNPNVVAFDWRQLQRWRIDQARLPARAIVRYRQPGTWEQYKDFIIVAVVLFVSQTVLIAALLIQRAKGRRVQHALGEHQQRYALATAAGAVGVWDWDLKTNAMYVDPQLKRILGYRDDEIRNHLDDWGQRVHPDDGDAVMARAQACIDGRVETYEVEHRMLHKDGSTRWFFARGSVLRRADGTAYRLVGTDTDITERKRVQGAIAENEAALRASSEEVRTLAGRLIVAQEAERTRIARDLHDDVSQQLAGLSIALSQLKRQVSGGQDGDEIRDALNSLQQRTIALAEGIRYLSHDLHPGVLRHAGLVAALTAHCDEFRRQRAIELTLQADDRFGSIGPESDLCLYRVAQEALRNIATHAKARHVVVRLVRTDTTAQLSIEDDGKGFDIADVRHHRDGLGLLSIYERVKLAGGTVSIVTEPDHGTTVRVRIPVEGDTRTQSPGARETQRTSP